jgi:ribonuclease Y
MGSTVIAAVVVAIGALVIGIFLGKLIFAKNTKQQLEEADVLAKKTIEDAKTLAETLKEKKLLEAKEHFLHLKALTTKKLVNVTRNSRKRE